MSQGQQIVCGLVCVYAIGMTFGVVISNNKYHVAMNEVALVKQHLARSIDYETQQQSQWVAYAKQHCATEIQPIEPRAGTPYG